MTRVHLVVPAGFDDPARPSGGNAYDSRIRAGLTQLGWSVQVLAVNGKPSSIQLPTSVELQVVETEPGVRGDTVSNVTKPATLETGAVVQVPMFVNVGDRLKVDPREGRYISRA